MSFAVERLSYHRLSDHYAKFHAHRNVWITMERGNNIVHLKPTLTEISHTISHSISHTISHVKSYVELEHFHM